MRRAALWEGRSDVSWRGVLGARTVEVYAELPSTNDRGLEILRQGLPLPAVVVADRQTEGRGRLGRSWASDTHLGLWFSLARQVPGEGGVLPLLAGLAVCQGAEAAAPGLCAGLKWPNDVLVGERKLGGVLCERAQTGVVVGIGVNVNHREGDFPPDPSKPVTSMFRELGREVDRGRLLASIVEALDGLWPADGGRIGQAALAELNRRSSLRGRRLWVDGVVRHSSGALEATSRLNVTGGDVSPDGFLEVRDEGGLSLWLISGSIRDWERCPPVSPETATRSST